jgi:hypothetical protein
VACPDGKVPVGGGFEPVPNPPPPGVPGNAIFLTLVSSAPALVNGATSVNGWNVMLRNGSGSSRSNVQFRVWALCAVQP